MVSLGAMYRIWLRTRLAQASFESCRREPPWKDRSVYRETLRAALIVLNLTSRRVLIAERLRVGPSGSKTKQYMHPDKEKPRAWVLTWN